MSTSTAGYNRIRNIGTAVTAVVKVGPVRFYSLTCLNLNAANRYFQLHNLAAVPTGGEVPVLVFLVPANSQIVIGIDFFSEEGHEFSVGLVWAFSTTAFTYTAASAADQFSCIRYT